MKSIEEGGHVCKARVSFVDAVVGFWPDTLLSSEQ